MNSGELQKSVRHKEPHLVDTLLCECFSLSAAHQMLKYDLGYHPYQLQIVQECKETDFAGWKDFLEQFLHLQLSEDVELFLFNNEAHFELSECINKQNMRYWLANNPSSQISKLLHS